MVRIPSSRWICMREKDSINKPFWFAWKQGFMDPEIRNSPFGIDLEYQNHSFDLVQSYFWTAATTVRNFNCCSIIEGVLTHSKNTHLKIEDVWFPPSFSMISKDTSIISVTKFGQKTPLDSRLGRSTKWAQMRGRFRRFFSSGPGCCWRQWPRKLRVRYDKKEECSSWNGKGFSF